MARPSTWAWRAVLWIAVFTVVLATVLLQVVVRPQLADDPLVGAGRLDQLAVADAPDPVLARLTPSAGTVDAGVLAARIGSLPTDGLGESAALVVDAGTGAELFRQGGGARIPASSLKVLSALVAFDVLGPERRFATSTHLAADGGTVVLRGGGDPLLTGATRPDAHPRPASLEELAALTAAELTRRGATTVNLGFDGSLFAGPGWNPAWPEVFNTSVAPITALTADHARPSLEREAFERAPDPALFAAERFGDFLRAHGVTVSGVGPIRTPGDAVALASVDSLPVSAIADRVLAHSDNDAAETLLWHVALERGQPATPESGAAVFEAELRARGLWDEGMVVKDGNGISSDNRVTPDALVRAMREIVTNPETMSLAAGLPVAGVTGTLWDRFENEDAVSGRGVVRAKTGTIAGVNTLTGYVVTAQGQPLVFALMTSGGAGQTSARAWLDRVTATLASCGCS